jgi:hypothetical protein
MVKQRIIAKVLIEAQSVPAVGIATAPESPSAVRVARHLGR